MNSLFHRFSRLPLSQKISTIFFVAICGFFFGAKTPVQFYFWRGLSDDGSYVEDDFVHISWVKSGVPYVPNTSTVFVDYRELKSTNEWMELSEANVTKYYIDVYLANAKSYEYNIWWYNEEEEVHTNGVWIYKTVGAKSQSRDSNSFDIIPSRAKVEADGKTIAPPNKKEE